MYYSQLEKAATLLRGTILGGMEDENGNDVAAMRHWRLSALVGSRFSMDNSIARFEQGLFQHVDLAESLKAFYRARAELKTKSRDKYIELLKRTGEYRGSRYVGYFRSAGAIFDLIVSLDVQSLHVLCISATAYRHSMCVYDACITSLNCFQAGLTSSSSSTARSTISKLLPPWPRFISNRAYLARYA